MRKKIELKWIDNPISRRESLRKRRQGLVKKVRELSTLCDISASVIIYSPDEPQPLTWPSSEIVKRNLEKYYNMPELQRTQKMKQQESYVKDSIRKLESKFVKQQRKNSELEFTHLMDVFHGICHGRLGDGDFVSLISLAKEKQVEIQRRLEYLHEGVVAFEDEQFGGDGSRMWEGGLVC